jgi:hypothetical protein
LLPFHQLNQLMCYIIPALSTIYKLLVCLPFH